MKASCINVLNATLIDTCERNDLMVRWRKKWVQKGRKKLDFGSNPLHNSISARNSSKDLSFDSIIKQDGKCQTTVEYLQGTLSSIEEEHKDDCIIELEQPKGDVHLGATTEPASLLGMLPLCDPTLTSFSNAMSLCNFPPFGIFKNLCSPHFSLYSLSSPIFPYYPPLSY